MDVAEKCSDPVDMASEHEAMFLSIALTHRKPEGPQATGECLWCGGGELAQGRRWCDAECRNEFETHTKTQKR